MSIRESDIAAALQVAPAWAKLGLSMRDERRRLAAADELSRHIAASLNGVGSSECGADVERG